jgi:hypothetical protein
MPEKISVSVQLLNAIFGYMGKQPYEQVAPLIQAIQNEAKGQVPDQETEEVAEAT